MLGSSLLSSGFVLGVVSTWLSCYSVLMVVHSVLPVSVVSFYLLLLFCSVAPRSFNPGGYE